jgi:tetratricopeptide (TPR) repeat protein
VNLGEWTDEELLQKGREALRVEQYARATELLAEHCDRLTREGKVVSPGVLASYALSLGYTRRLKEGLALCQKAVAADRRNPHVYWSLARLSLLAGLRKKALEAVETGLRLAPENPALLRIREELGVRQTPPIRFLPRKSTLNVRLGKAIHRLKSPTARRPGR